MLRNHLSAIILLFLPFMAWNQECPVINTPVLVFLNQEDVQNFAETYPSCTEIPYDILITGEVEDLGPLSYVQKVNGRLNIRDADLLTSLSGLENLQEVEGQLDLDGNESLADISALDNLTRVGSLDIRGNKRFNILSGFTGLVEVEGRLNIFDNRELTEISAFTALEVVGEDLRVSREKELLSITGFPNLKEVGNQIKIDEVGKLEMITGFNQLTKIGNNLKITANGLNSIGGFEKLDSIGGSLHIICYPAAYSISGFNSLKYIRNDLSFDRGLGSLEGFEQLNRIDGSFSFTSSNGLKSVPNFPNLEVIGGSFAAFNNPDLEHLPSFPALGQVGGNINITQNRSLRAIGAFQQIEKINGFVHVVRNDSLAVFAAFSALDTITKNLQIESNSSLSSLAGFEQLQFIGDYLEVINCVSLEDITALTNLNHIGGSISVRGNTQLRSLQGLSSITKAQDLRIESNHSLENLSGLENLSSVEKLSVSYNNGIQNIQALSSLEEIRDGHLAIRSNKRLLNLSGLEHLKQLNGGIFISDNDALLSITALDSIDITGISDLFIRSNRELRYCNAPSICNFLSNSSSYRVIERNASGCDEEIEILRYCQEYLPTVIGNVFVDQDCDGEVDSLDTMVPEVILLESASDLPFAITDSNGVYIRGLAFDTIAQFDLRPLDYFDIEPAAHQITTADTIALYDQKNFSLCPQETIPDLNIDLVSVSPPRPGFVHEYEVCIRNTGTIPVTGELSFSFTGENNELWIDSLFVEEERITNSGTTWVSPTIAPFSRSCYEIKAYLIPDESILGQKLLPKAMVTLIDQQDANPEDNLDSLSLTIVGSYDPNDKRASVDSLNFATVDGPVYLEYIIRFQNTGTFRAEFIEVTDTINSAFDLGTFTMLSCSHNYQLKFKEGRLLSWFFPGIQLPPSDEDEAASNGYIKFGIKTKPGVKLDDVLSNKAYIYFDFNSPIITNEATTRFFTVTSISSIPEGFDIKVYPNPAQDYITIEVEDIPRREEIRVHLFSADGRLLQDQKVTSLPNGRYTIPTKQLPPGIYLLQLSLAGQRQTFKLMK